MAQQVEGKLYKSITGQLFELGRQLRQKSGYPFNPAKLHEHLQDAIEGKFDFRWQIDEDGVIHISVTGLGLSGFEMKKHLVSEGHGISDWAEQLLDSPDYVPCEKNKVYNLTILPGKLFSDAGRTMKNARVAGDRRGLIHGKNLPTEIGALIRLNFTNDEIEQMGFKWLITIHESVEDSDGGPGLLSTGRDGGGSWLSAGWDGPESQWLRESGFVFLASQVSPQN